MTDDFTEGSGQPGIPRPFRRNQRRVYSESGTRRIESGTRVHVHDCPCPHITQLVGVEYVRYCVWPTIHVSRKRFWSYIVELLGRKAKQIIKVSKVTQRRDNRLRFDLYLKRDKRKVLRRIKIASRERGWYCRYHHKWRNRQTSRAERGSQGSIVSEYGEQRAENVEEQMMVDDVRSLTEHEEELRYTAIPFATWNIRTLTGKRSEVEQFILHTKVQVLALQETRRTSQGWRVRLRGFQVFESIASNERGRNGLALYVHDALGGHEIGGPSPYYLVVRMSLGNTIWNVVNLYIPPTGTGTRSEALMQLKLALRSLFNQALDAKVVVMGDWNTSPEKVSRWLRRHRLPMSLVALTGRQDTFFRGNHGSCIDHVVVSAEGSEYLSSTRVNRQWDLSDHWPVQGLVRCPTADFNPIPIIQYSTMDSLMLKRSNSQVANHPFWEALLQNDQDEEEDEYFLQAFDTTTKAVGEDMDLMRTPQQHKAATYKLSAGAKQAINRRRAAYAQWSSQVTPVQGDQLWMRYEELRVAAKNAKQTSCEISWAKHILDGSAQLAKGNFKAHWNWVNRLSGRKVFKPSVLAGPLIVDNEVAYGEQAVRGWISFTEELYTDTGHSKDAEYWENLLPGEAALPLPEMNDPVQWPELNSVLNNLSNWKSPSIDGIPYELAKTAAESINSPAYRADAPNSRLGKVLLRVVNALLRNGVPTAWNQMGLTFIHKKDDPKCPDNYRGIASIKAIVKIATIVVTKRVQKGLEDRNWFAKEQAGFRSAEECVGQATALFEVLRRRSLSGLRTYVGFVDFRKAYDTVPHEALLRKLRLAGVDGLCESFLRSRYENGIALLKTGNGYIAREIPVSIGSKQGCPASPLEFDVFINDIVRSLDGLGVSVNGLEGEVVGLLFADDLVLLAPTRNKLVQQFTCTEDWARKHDMSFGVSKCGVMGFGVGAMRRARRHVNRWKLGGEVVKVVDEYIYLGLLFTPALDLHTMALARAEKGRKAFETLRPVLSSKRIPVEIRLRLVKACLIPVLTYGAELWGMNEARVHPCQRILDRAIRSLLGVSGKSNATALSVLHREFDISPLAATVASARARAVLKYRNSRTIIGDLVRNPPVRLRKHTWLSGAWSWLHRFHANIAVDTSPREGSSMVQHELWSRHDGNCRALSWGHYQQWRFHSTRSYLAEGLKYPSAALGISWLTRCRVGALWTSHRFVQARLLDANQWRDCCPCCAQQVPRGETLEHMVLLCVRWADYRERYLGDILRWISDNLHLPSVNEADQESLQIILHLCLGGDKEGDQQVYRIPDWCGLHVLGNEVNVDGLVHPIYPFGGPPFVRVARFLQDVMKVRVGILHRILGPPRADAVFDGMAAFIEPEALVLQAPAET